MARISLLPRSLQWQGDDPGVMLVLLMFACWLLFAPGGAFGVSPDAVEPGHTDHHADH
jgi:hypothetical protein